MTYSLFVILISSSFHTIPSHYPHPGGAQATGSYPNVGVPVPGFQGGPSYSYGGLGGNGAPAGAAAYQQQQQQGGLGYVLFYIDCEISYIYIHHNFTILVAYSHS